MVNTIVPITNDIQEIQHSIMVLKLQQQQKQQQKRFPSKGLKFGLLCLNGHQLMVGYPLNCRLTVVRGQLKLSVSTGHALLFLAQVQTLRKLVMGLSTFHGRFQWVYFHHFFKARVVSTLRPWLRGRPGSHLIPGGAL